MRAFLVILVTLSTILWGCRGAPVEPTPPPPDPIESPAVASLELWPGTSFELAPNEVLQLVATPRAADGTKLLDRKVTWMSSNAASATVKPTGEVYTVGEGEAVIKAECEGITADAMVRVSIPFVPVEWIEIVEGPALTLAPGATVELHVIAHAANGDVLEGRPVTWSSKASDIATVNTAGLVTTFIPGATVITAEVETKTDELALTVFAEPELPPLSRSQAGGETRAVAVLGNLAYAGVGPRLTIWDLASQTPVHLGETVELLGTVTGVVVNDGIAYVVTSGHETSTLYVIDVSSSAAPAVITATKLGMGKYSRLTDVALAGERLYVTDAEQGLFALSIANPSAPVEVANAPAFNAHSVQPVGNRVHVATVYLQGGRGVTTYDAASLTMLGSVYYPDANAIELTPNGLVAGNTFNGLFVDDLSNPSVPVRRFSAPLVTWALVAGADRIWITVDGEIRNLDVSNPNAITLSEPAGTIAWAITAGAANAERLVLVDHQGWLGSYSVANANTPTSLARVPTGPCAHCYATARIGTLIAVAETTPGAVGTVGTATGDNLDLVGRYQQLTVDFEDIAAIDNRVYVADWFTGLQAFDFSNPAEPTPLATLTTGGYPVAIATDQDLLYLAEDTVSGGAVRVFIDGAGGPTELGAVATPNLNDLAVAAGRIFITHANTLSILDAADPKVITPIGAYTGCDAVNGVAATATLVALGCTDGLHLVDITNPASPILRSTWPLVSTSGWLPVALDGSRAYLGHAGGVLAIDISDLDAPKLISSLKTAWLVRHLAVVAPGRLVASAGPAGIYQWDFQ